MRKVTLLATLLLLAPSVAQAKTLEDLLVEKGVITKGEAATSASAGASKVYWNKGTRVDFPTEGFTFGINTLIQTRYTFTDADESFGGKNRSSFDVHEARIIVSGSVLNEEFTYHLEADFVGATDVDTAKSQPDLKDAYITWHACDWADLKMGQFKTGIGRQFDTPDWLLQFADRSQSSDFFNLGRQSGLEASGKLMDGAISVSAGLFNGLSTGEGINGTGVDTNHTGIVNVRGNVLGEMNPYAEGDVDWTEDMAINLGGAYAYSEATNVVLGDFNQDDVTFDANFKWIGWSAQGEYFYSRTDPDGAEKVQPQGFYVQAGYFLDPKTIELAARYSLTDCDNGAGSGICSGQQNVNEVTVGVNYFFWKHFLKAQFNFVHLNLRAEGDGSDENENRWLLQLSSYL